MNAILLVGAPAEKSKWLEDVGLLRKNFSHLQTTVNFSPWFQPIASFSIKKGQWTHIDFWMQSSYIELFRNINPRGGFSSNFFFFLTPYFFGLIIILTTSWSVFLPLWLKNTEHKCIKLVMWVLHSFKASGRQKKMLWHTDKEMKHIQSLDFIGV